MPKVKPLTRRQREEQAVEDEIRRVEREFNRAVGLKRGLEDKTYLQLAEEIGVSAFTLNAWRHGKLRDAGMGRVVTAARKLGYRIVFEPIAPGKRESA